MPKKISENTEYLQLDEEIRGMQYLARIFPFLFIKEQRKQIACFRSELDELRCLPDKFNTLFVSRGWVCYETMNKELLSRCIELGQIGDYDGAEQELVSYYNGDIRYLVIPLRNTSGFRKRYGLLEKALDDYHSGRYYSCTPLFLMIIDGAVNEVLKKNQGLFAQNNDLVLEDSIVGNESGLPALVKILSKSRKQTTTDVIPIPYRNGIIHGMDLGYDNVLVATKSLALLFAVAEWIRQHEKQKPTPQVTGLRQTLVDYAKLKKKLNAQRRLIDAWTPRSFDSADFESFIPGPESPEQRVCDFFNYYKVKNYGKMAELLSDRSNNSLSKEAGYVRNMLENIKCVDYRLLSVDDKAPAVSEVSSQVTVDRLNGIQKVIEVRCRLLYQAARDSKSVMCRYEAGGQWFILDTLLCEILNQAYREY